MSKSEKISIFEGNWGILKTIQTVREFPCQKYGLGLSNLAKTHGKGAHSRPWKGGFQS